VLKFVRYFRYTANAFQEDRMRCMEVGMNGFITKPTMPDKLYEAIFEALENSFRLYV
jgi:CheY-like chemotaxis protein